MCSQHLERRELERSQVVRGAPTPAPVMTTHNTLVVDLSGGGGERGRSQLKPKKSMRGQARAAAPPLPSRQAAR